MTANANTRPHGLSIVAPLQPNPDESWEAYLRRNSSTTWRTGEWDSESLMFTGDRDNPRTVVYRCQTNGCETLAVTRRGHCHRCRASIAKGEEPVPRFWDVEQKCHGQGVPNCYRPQHIWGLCRNHSFRFRRTGQSLDRLPDWVLTQVPLEPFGPCALGWCGFTRFTGNVALCQRHHRDMRKRSVSETDYFVTARPPVAAHQFTLAYCSPELAAEIVYGLQRRDEHGANVRPFAVREFVAHVEGAESLLSVDASALPGTPRQTLDNLVPYVAELHDRYTGTDPLLSDVWPPHVAFLFHTGKDKRHAPRGVWDWREVESPWLRELGKKWVADTLPQREKVAGVIRALRYASSALRGTAALRDPGAAELRHMTRIMTHLEKTADLSYGQSTALAGIIRRMVLHCRTAGYMQDVPPGFAVQQMHEMKKTDRASLDEEPGRYIPEKVIEHLDQNLGSFKPDYKASHRAHGWSNDDYGYEWRTIYEVMRDTGRRPSEVTNLRFDCLENVTDDGGYLRWDNRKAQRFNRRLPIWPSTVTIIANWQRHLRTLVPDLATDGPLFPTPTTRPESLKRPLPMANYGQKFMAWARGLPDLPAVLEDLADDGEQFALDDLILYGLRHSYAQLAADAGMDPVVLKDLMDHQSLDTTTGYFKVSKERKRSAIQVLNRVRTDIQGRDRPVQDLETYQRTEVATILGGCVEPSNVKSGGKACPIRFQCGACSHYRPDPTYVPEIEREIRRLRADIAIAEISATTQVVENLQYNVGMLQAVLLKMRERVASLTPEEQAVYEVFYSEVRKSRRILDLTVIDRRAAQ